MRIFPLCANEKHVMRMILLPRFAHNAHVLRMELKPTNLTLPDELIVAARTYVAKRKKTNRGFSLSEMVTGLLVTKLRSVGVKLPAEFALKK